MSKESECQKIRVTGSGTGLGAYALAATGGCVDAVGFLALGGLFVSHMSGNSAAFGAYFGQGQFALGLPHFMAVPVFVLGLLFGNYFVLHETSGRRCATLLFLEALLISSFLVAVFFIGEPAKGSGIYYLVCPLLLFAMGMQNAVLRGLGHSTFATTYVTGVLDRFAQSVAKFFRHTDVRLRKEAINDARVSICVWSAYALGAVAGSAGMFFVGTGILLVPVVLLLVFAWRVRKGV